MKSVFLPFLDKEMISHNETRIIKNNSLITNSEGILKLKLMKNTKKAQSKIQTEDPKKIISVAEIDPKR